MKLTFFRPDSGFPVPRFTFSHDGQISNRAPHIIPSRRLYQRESIVSHTCKKNLTYSSPQVLKSGIYSWIDSLHLNFMGFHVYVDYICSSSLTILLLNTKGTSEPHIALPPVPATVTVDSTVDHGHGAKINVPASFFRGCIELKKSKPLKIDEFRCPSRLDAPRLTHR